MITGTVIEVTQEIIDESAARRDKWWNTVLDSDRYSASCGCAITTAIKRIFAETKWTELEIARIGDGEYSIPGTQEFMDAFDDRKTVKPFSFTIGERIA